MHEWCIKMKNYILRIIGLIFYGIGILGYFVPGLPGTIFIILAAFCFLRSYPKLYKKIINNPNYGSVVEDFILYRLIPKKVKLIILLCIWFFSLFSAFYFLSNLYYKIIVLILACIGSLVVMSARNKKDKRA